MKVISIVGARPQFVKLAAVASAFAHGEHEHRIIHTGQHYDVNLSDVFFSGLGIPAADVHLGVGSGSHGVQTGTVLAALDEVLASEKPDWVLVYGDTNSTLAGALSAAKMHIPVAHLEAGLRSFNRQMPEEHNRVLTDHCADLLLAPTQEAMRHLGNEGLGGRAVLVGDVMVDVCLSVRDKVLAEGRPPSSLPDGVDSSEPYVLATLHRAENTDDPHRLGSLIESLASVPMPVALLAHPRLVARAEQHGIKLAQGSIVVGEPVSYTQMVSAVLNAATVITDSGGLQKEAFLLGAPCTTLRTETEWPETLADGWNLLVPNPAELRADEWHSRATRKAPQAPTGSPYGDGRAAERVVAELAARSGG